MKIEERRGKDTCMMGFRATKAEREIIKKLAESMGKTVSDYIRYWVMEDIKKRGLD